MDGAVGAGNLSLQQKAAVKSVLAQIAPSMVLIIDHSLCQIVLKAHSIGRNRQFLREIPVVTPWDRKIPENR